MTSAPHALEADWLGACRRATEALRQVLHDRPTTRERVEETGERGEGGDRTLVIDQFSEDAVFAELDRLHAEGACFTAISEERGEVEIAVKHAPSRSEEHTSELQSPVHLVC